MGQKEEHQNRCLGLVASSPNLVVGGRVHSASSSTGSVDPTDSTLCTDFRCTGIPATRVGEVLACGLPFVLSLWIAWKILKGNAFRLDRSSYVAELNVSALTRNPFSYESNAPWIARLLKCLTLSPLATAVFWCLMVWFLLEDYYEYKRLPTAVACALAALCMIICLGAYGFLHWQASKFRMTKTTGFCFIGCIVIVLALQLGFTLFVIDRAQSAFVVFMTFNLAPIMLISYLHGVIAPPITFQQFLRLQGRDPKWEQDCAKLAKTLTRLKWALLAFSVGALFIFGFIMEYLFDSVFGWQVSAAVLFCDFATFVHNSSGLASDPILLHCLGLFCRAILFICWDSWWFVAVSINFLVFIAFFIYHIIDRRYPTFSKEDALDSVVGSIESAMDEKRNQEQQERVAAHEEMERAMKQLEEHQQGGGGHLEKISRGVDEIRLKLKQHMPGARFVSDGADRIEAGAREFAEELERTTMSAFKSAEFALAILSLIYVVYTIIALYAALKSTSWEYELFPPIELATSHPQYQVGVITALLIVCATLFFLTFRVYEINNFHWNRRVGFTGAAFLVVSIGSSIGVSFITGSDLIYIFGIYIPLIAVASTLTYCNWRRQDYRWNGWAYYQEGVYRKMKKEESKHEKLLEEEDLVRKHTLSLAAREQDGSDVALAPVSPPPNGESVSSPSSASSRLKELFPINKLGSVLKLHFAVGQEYNCPHHWKVEPEKDPKFLPLMFSDFISFKHTSPDYIIIFSVAFLTMLCIGLGVHLGQNEGNKAYSYFIAAIVGMIIFTIFILLKWFNTFSVGSIQVIVLSGLLIYCSYELYQVSSDVGVIPTMALALLYPAGMFLIMAFYSWKMNNWKLSSVIKRLMFAACTLVFAFIIVLIVATQDYVEGVIGLLIFFVSVYFLVLVMVWSSNDFHLPRIYFRSAVAVSSALILIALIVILILNKTWFQMVTVLWVFALVGLAAYTIQEMRENDTRKLLPSPYIFPVYEYSPKLNEILINVRNNGMISMILFAALMMAWGFVAALLIKPPYVGWIFFCLGALSLWVIAMEALFKPIITFWRNFLIVQDAPALIDHAREVALKSQFGSQDTAFENEEENEKSEDGSEGVGASTEDDSFKTLKRLQMYWNFEEKSEVDHLQRERKKFIAHPQVPEDNDVSERAKFIAATIANFDAKIAKVFEEQTRILVMFQLLINIGSQAFLKKNRARVKDFLRKYFARKAEIIAAKEQGLPIPKRRRTTVASSNAPGASVAQDDDEDDEYDDNQPLIDLSTSNAIEIQEWAAKNEELKRKAIRYVQELQESGQEAKRKQEEQRAAVMERKKLVAGGINVVPATPHPSSVPTPMKPVVVKAADEQKQQPTISIQPTPLPATPTTPLPNQSTASPATSFISPTKTTAKSPQHGDPTKVERDDFSYRQRGISFDIDHLNIRGPTAESVVTQARAAVSEIIARHSKVKELNKGIGIEETSLFADPFFPPVADLDSLIEAGTDPADKAPGAIKKQRKACWKRVREISAAPKIFASGKLDPALIIQGDLEDCYLLSALSVIARTPERIKNLFLVNEYNEYGIYGMTFFVDGEWRAVFVDDQFPFLGNKLAFARSKNPDEFWVPILEKCYAKLYAGYPSIIGGLVHVSFKDLTGGITDEVALDTADSGAFDGRLWQRLYAYFKEGYLMGAGNPKPSAGNFTVVNGIVQGHAYAILDLREIGDIKLIQCRNPWGEGEWTGDWGDGSDKWTQKMRTLCDYEENTDSDGIFWMAFEDFATQFQRVYICRVFDSVIELDTRGMVASKVKPPPAVGNNTPWYKVSVGGAWKGPSAAGHVCHIKKFPDRKPELNPQFQLKLVGDRPSIVFLTLTQPTQTGGGQYLFISLLVLKKNGLRAHDVKKSELIGGNTKCRNSREICAEVSLEANTVHTIFVSTYQPNEESNFTLAAYSRYPIILNELPASTACS